LFQQNADGRALIGPLDIHQLRDSPIRRTAAAGKWNIVRVLADYFSQKTRSLAPAAGIFDTAADSIPADFPLHKIGTPDSVTAGMDRSSLLVLRVL
jgi:hypothetical protein